MGVKRFNLAEHPWGVRDLLRKLLRETSIREMHPSGDVCGKISQTHVGHAMQMKLPLTASS